MSTPPLLVDATCEFLRRHTPFNRMSDDSLAALVPRLKLAYYAKDKEILSPQSGPVQTLYIVQRGLVGSRPDNPQADPDSTLGPGELSRPAATPPKCSARCRTRSATSSRATIFCSCGATRRSSSASARRRSPRR